MLVKLRLQCRVFDLLFDIFQRQVVEYAGCVQMGFPLGNAPKSVVLPTLLDVEQEINKHIEKRIFRDEETWFHQRLERCRQRIPKLVYLLIADFRRQIVRKPVP